MSLVPVCPHLLSDLESFQRLDLSLAEDFPAIPKQDKQTASALSLSSPPPQLHIWY